MGGEEVLEDCVATDEFVVDHHGEMNVQDDIVVDGQSHQDPNQLVLLL